MERSIKGKVLVLENGIPIPNLVIVAYDIDNQDSYEPGNFDSLQRLGSANTNQSGDFTFEYDITDFQTGDREQKPDLILAVFAPLVAGADIDNEATLYFTRTTRQNSGHEEAYVILIPLAILEEQGISLLLDSPGEDEPEDSLGNIARSLRDKTLTRKNFTDGISPEIIRRLELKHRYSKTVSHLMGGAAPAGMMTDTFVPMDLEMPEFMQRIRQKGVERLAAIDMPGITLFADKSTLNQLDIAQNAKRMTDEQLKDLYGDLSFPESSYDPLQICLTAKQLEQSKQSEASNGTSSTNGTTNTSPSETSTDKKELYKDLNNTIQDLLKKTNFSSGRLTGISREAQLLKQLENGPGDVPSFHDFHTVQIAWENVWTALIDKKRKKEISDLYEEIMKTINPKIPKPVDPNDKTQDPEIKDLEALLLSLEDTIEVGAGVAADLEEAPELIAWLPELGAVWNQLSEKKKNEFWFLFYLDGYRADGDWSNDLEKSMKKFLDDLRKSDHKETGSKVLGLKKYTYLLGDTKIMEVYPGWGKDKAKELIAKIKLKFNQDIVSKTAGKLARLKETLEEIKLRLKAPYRFDVFKYCTYNYGFVSTFRQKWKPMPHQVGDLVATIPLAPNEKKTYTKKRSIKTSRAQKEIEKSMASHAGESTETSRAEAEILRKASSSTNFSLSASGGFSVGIANVNLGTNFGSNQGNASSNAKKNFRQLVRKAASEYKKERTVEISTSTEFVDEFTETGEIKNENDELTVTYLFYELQRVFEVSERLHKLTPVILVAFEVPPPDEIDEDWLVSYEWILRRVILDDIFLVALDYLTDSFAGDELSVEIQRTQWETQIDVVRKLHIHVSEHQELRTKARESLNTAMQQVAASGGGGLMGPVSSMLFGGIDNSESIEARKQARQKALEWAQTDMLASQEKLGAGITALQEATNAYTQVLEQQLNRKITIDQLKIHVKQNILYYMQAIWLHEPSDQRYFRIYNKEVVWPERQGDYSVKKYKTPTYSNVNPSWWYDEFGAKSKPAERVSWEVKIPSHIALDKKVKLHEIADIDNLLGFKGNLAIFPLREQNALTLFMMQQYLDSRFKLLDPDPLGVIPTPTEAVELARCAWGKKDTTDKEKKKITEWLSKVLGLQKETSEQIIVPTGQLFIEALPGEHPILEDFKLMHRMYDAQKAKAEMHKTELEAIRYAARILEDQLEDPEVQTKIVSDGSGGIVIQPPGPAKPTP